MHATIRALLACTAATALLAACDAKLPASRFQADICGQALAWEQAHAGRETTLYVAQLPGQPELTVAFGLPGAHPAEPGQPPYPGTLQFNLTTAPDMLTADRIGLLQRTFTLATDDPATPRREGTGVATFFLNGQVERRSTAGELHITGVRVVDQNDAGRALAVASGHFRIDAAPQPGAAPCALSGTFQDGSFALRR